MDAIKLVEHRVLKEMFKKDIPRFKSGDKVKVHIKVIEGQNRRIQIFEGDVIRRKGSGLSSCFTVRKISYGVGVERTFPFHSPYLDKIEVIRVGKTRKASLYYLRKKIGKAARIQERT